MVLPLNATIRDLVATAVSYLGGADIQPVAAPGESGAAIAEHMVRRRTVSPYRKLAIDVDATDTTAETVYVTCPVEAVDGIRIVGGRYLTDGTLTSHDTNFATIIIERQRIEAVATMISWKTKTLVGGGTGSWGTFSAVAGVADPTVTLAPGESATIQIDKAGAGVKVPAGVVQVDIEML